jgi:hypothetical protein
VAAGGQQREQENPDPQDPGEGDPHQRIVGLSASPADRERKGASQRQREQAEALIET